MLNYRYKFSLGYLDGTAFVIEDDYDCEEACNRIQDDCRECSVVGFDAEWRPQWVKGRKRNRLSLLQISTPESGQVFLFRLSKLRYVPYCLQDILRDDEIVKVGVGPRQDRDYIHQDYEVRTLGILDLHRIYHTKESLASLARNVLDVTLDKEDYWRSDWDQLELSYGQVCYAARDAYASVEIFKRWAGIKFDEYYGDFNRQWCSVIPEIGRYVDEPSKRRCPVQDTCYDRHSDEQCIVCGTTEYRLIKKNIVPTSFIRHFPENSSTTACCDIQLICKFCERDSQDYAQILSDHLDYAAGGHAHSSVRNNNYLLRKYARDNNPRGLKTVTAKFLRQSECWRICSSLKKMSLGEAVVKLYLDNHQPLWKLEKLWRDMFIEAMNPQYIPQCWEL